MLQLIYASAATEPFTPDALRTLLARARSRNDLYQVSGLLVYHEGSFLQVLEGPEHGVDTILASIYKDPRHGNERTLLRHQVTKREFDRWSMAFVDTRNNQSALPAGLLKYTPSLDNLAADRAGKARQYLRSFQMGLFRQRNSA